MTQLISTMCRTGEWPHDFTQVKIIPLKKKPKRQNAAISLTSHATKIVVRLRRGVERKIENVLGEDKFEFRRGTGSEMQLKI